MLYKSSHRLMMVSALCFGALTMATQPAHAELSRSGLLNLAKNFIDDVGQGFDQADNHLNRNNKSVAPSIPLTTIPDGEELIMRVLVGPHKIPLNFDILAIKDPNDISVSLADFFGAADLHITVDAKNGTAFGWFIREEQDFFLDLTKQEITIQGKTTALPADSVKIKDGDIYASSYVIGGWFDMRFIVDFTELSIMLSTTQPLPAEERYARRHNLKNSHSTVNKPKLPQKDIPYQAASIPFVDLNLSSSYNKFQDSDPKISHAWSAISAGDLASHTVQSFASGTNEDKLNNLRVTFSKESDEPNLLGPLKAHNYSFGDIYPTRLPLTGSSSQEQGVHITNSPSQYNSNLDTTEFHGDAQPGWDVELYRNDRLVEFKEITSDGQYNFENVRLFVGENNFRLVFYGPLGEVREQHKNINVTANQLTKGKGYYDVSVSRNNAITYRSTEFNEPENDAIHVVARYDKGIGQNTAAYAGLRHRQEENDVKTYVEAGLTTNINDTLINASTALDATTGGIALNVTGRRNFDRHSLSSTTRVNSDTYIPGNDDENPSIISSSLDLTGPVDNFFGLRTHYGIGTDYFLRKDGSSNTGASASLDTRIGNTVLSKSIEFDRQNDGDDNTTNFIGGSVNMHGFIKRARWRLRSAYDVIPERQLRNLFSSISYPFTNDVSGLLEAEHFLTSSRTKLTSSMNLKTEKAVITPRLSVDTDDTVQASVNVRFGIGHDPHTSSTHIYSQRLTASGGISAFVFLDKNGNGLHDDGEETLPDIEIDAVQARKSAMTDDKGIAFIPDLPKGRLTDVKVDMGTLEDPYWISSYAGLSVRPREGIVTQVTFPIVTSGEIDGTIYLKNKDKQLAPARQFTLNLIRPDGSNALTTQTAYDGFYIFDTIPPGTYYMTISSDDAKKTGSAAPLPKKITISPEGTTLYGEDITMTSVAKNGSIGYLFRSLHEPVLHPYATPVPPDTETANIILGQYKSRLAMTLNWYKIKLQRIAGALDLTTPLSDIKRDTETGLYSLRVTPKSHEIITPKMAYQACTQVVKSGIPCFVEIISDYNTRIADNGQNKS